MSVNKTKQTTAMPIENKTVFLLIFLSKFAAEIQLTFLNFDVNKTDTKNIACINTENKVYKI